MYNTCDIPILEERNLKRTARSILFAVLLFSVLTTACSRKAPEDAQEGSGVVTLAAVGDIFVTDDMLLDAKHGNGVYDFSPQFSGILPAISTADIAIGNFEGVFAGEPYGSDSGSYPDALADTLHDIGFQILQTANSYSVQQGISGLERTVSVLENAQIFPLGTYKDAAARINSPYLLAEVNGIRFAFIAFTKGIGGMSLPDSDAYRVNLLYSDYDSNYSKIDYDGISAVLGAVKVQKPDVIIASLHWGSENVSEVSESQEEIADYLFKNGVDVILGSHSHRVGEVERRSVTTNEGKVKNVLVAYSLGDFCAAESGEAKVSAVLNVEFTRDVESGLTFISDAGYTAVAAVDRGADEADRYAVMDADTAIALYEANHYQAVEQEIYEALVEKRQVLAEAIAPSEETEP